MSDFGDWFRSVPRFTRYWMAASVGFTLLGRFNLVSPTTLILYYQGLKNFELWRPITALFFYPLSPGTGFHYLINLYFLYNYSQRLESGVYAGRPADYLFMLIFNWILSSIFALLFDLYILMDPMVLSVLYIWCQLNKDTIVNFWFGTRFKAIYLPWVLLAFNMVLNGSGLVELIGIIVGHSYFFLMYKYPQELGGPALLQTPSFLKQFFPDTPGGVHGFGVPPERRQAAPPPPNRNNLFRGHNWGRGNVLGSQ